MRVDTAIQTLSSTCAMMHEYDRLEPKRRQWDAYVNRNANGTCLNVHNAIMLHYACYMRFLETCLS